MQRSLKYGSKNSLKVFNDYTVFSLILVNVLFVFIAKDSRKLTFIYLVNDVIQNSRKKGPEFRDQFGPVLAPAFKLMGQAMADENTQKRLERILNIWGDRNLFDAKLMSEFKKALGISNTQYHSIIMVK